MKSFFGGVEQGLHGGGVVRMRDAKVSWDLDIFLLEGL